jgi:hypothetical protein
LSQKCQRALFSRGKIIRIPISKANYIYIFLRNK